MATNPSEIVIGNKTLPLFSRKQLDCMSPQIMRQRGLDIKVLALRSRVAALRTKLPPTTTTRMATRP